jgi:hypothetical protein
MINTRYVRARQGILPRRHPGVALCKLIYPMN